jgi:chemotaxis protein methyltransferase CheR
VPVELHFLVMLVTKDNPEPPAPRTPTPSPIDQMMRSATSFFRDVMPFEVLRTQVLPALLEARADTKTLRILSAVCSSGQEAYSIALTIARHFPEATDWNVEIIALDPSQELISQASGGAYEQIVVQRGLPAMLLIKYFERVGHKWGIKDPPKSWVHFECLDLTSEPYDGEPFDVVFLANVLDKLAIDTHTEILDRVAANMVPDGYLFVGTAEAEVVSPSLFERIEDTRAPYFRLRS